MTSQLFHDLGILFSRQVNEIRSSFFFQVNCKVLLIILAIKQENNNLVFLLSDICFIIVLVSNNTFFLI